MKDVVLLEFFEDCGFDFYELIRHQEREESVGVGVDGDIQGDDLVEQGCGVDDVVDEGQDEHPERSEDLASSIEVSFQCLVRK